MLGHIKHTPREATRKATVLLKPVLRERIQAQRQNKPGDAHDMLKKGKWLDEFGQPVAINYNIIIIIRATSLR